MIRRFQLFIALQVVSFIFLMLPTHSNATSFLNIEFIIFQDGGTDVSVLAGTADASFDVPSSVLTIVLTNTSTAVASTDAASNLLTGIGFNLPSGVSIDPAATNTSIAITGGSSAINFTAPLGEDKWGIDNDPLTSGPFQGIITTPPFTVNTSVATLQASIDFDFNGVAQPSANVNGPSFGLLSGAVPSTTAGGQQAIQDSVTIFLMLAGSSIPPNIVDLINAEDVVLSFGSPTDGVRLPEPSTLLLLSFGLAGLGLLRRKRKGRGYAQSAMRLALRTEAE